MHSSRPITKNFLADFISDSTQNALDLKADDNSVLHTTGNEVKDGNLTLNDDLILPNIVDDVSSDISNVAISTITDRLVTVPTELTSSGNIKVAVTNKTGSAILKGSAVYIDGAQGSKATIALALADTNVTTSLALGIVENDIADNASGYVVAIGEIVKIDTSAFTNGDKIYVSPTIAGGLTSTIPLSPNNVMFIGTVTNSHATQGKILINVLYTFKLDRLVDVAITTPINNNLLVYETSSGLWKNKTLTDIGGITGSGTTNFVPKWGSANTLTNSPIQGSTTGNRVIVDGVDDNVHTLQVNGSTVLRDELIIDDGIDGRITFSNTTTNDIQSATTGFGAYKKVRLIASEIGFNTGASPTEKVVILPNGDVGINTTPTEKLHVDGNVLATSFIKSGGIPSQFLKADGSVDTTAYEDSVNKKTTMSGNESSNIFFLTAKAVYDWAVGLFAPLTRLLNINGNSSDLSANREWRVAQGDTGVLTFGTGITPNSTTTINIAPITGVVVDNESNPASPTFVAINYVGVTGITVTTLGSGTGTYVMLGSDGLGGGTISFQNTFPTSAERKTKIWIGKIGHPTGTIGTVINEPDYITSPQAFARDLFQVLGPYINDGVVAYPNGANLNVNLTVGNIHGNGINLHNSNTIPNEIATGPFAPLSFVYRTQTGAGGGAVSLITPGSYDVGGVITAIPGGGARSTIQYVFCIPGQGFVIQYGQQWYSNITEAIAAVGKETFVKFSNLVGNSILIGVIVTRKDATQLNDVSQAVFLNADKLGGLIGSSSGISVGTLQSGYDNSINPEILTNSTLGAFTVRRGSAADTDNIYEGNNGADSTTYSVDGNGKITGTSIVKSGATATDSLMGNGSTVTLSSGLYTPAITNSSNTSSLTTGYSSYQRIGDIVSVNVSFNLTMTAAPGTAQALIDLPIVRATAGLISQIGQGNVLDSSDDTIRLNVYVHSNSTTTARIVFYSPTNVNPFQGNVTFQYSVLS